MEVDNCFHRLRIGQSLAEWICMEPVRVRDVSPCMDVLRIFLFLIVFEVAQTVELHGTVFRREHDGLGSRWSLLAP